MPLCPSISTQRKTDTATVLIRKAGEAIVEFWTTNYEVEALLLVNSCARGKATRDSCLDVNVLARPQILGSDLANWEQQWDEFNQTNPAIQTLESVGKYSVVHLDISDGVFEPTEQDEAAVPDSFESGEILEKAQKLEQLLEEYAPDVEVE